jgi:hypothetical protein
MYTYMHMCAHVYTQRTDHYMTEHTPLRSLTDGGKEVFSLSESTAQTGKSLLNGFQVQAQGAHEDSPDVAPNRDILLGQEILLERFQSHLIL